MIARHSFLIFLRNIGAPSTGARLESLDANSFILERSASIAAALLSVGPTHAPSVASMLGWVLGHFKSYAKKEDAKQHRVTEVAAQALSLTARQNRSNGIIDAIVPEPAGGAHRDPRAASDALQGWIIDQLRDLSRVDPDTLVNLRFEKFRRMGSVRSG